MSISASIMVTLSDEGSAVALDGGVPSSHCEAGGDDKGDEHTSEEAIAWILVDTAVRSCVV